jgi:branched-chain amino acid transport system permease protein
MVIPFLIAWGTDSSACSRGKAFFWQSIFIEVFVLAALAQSYNLMFGFTGVVSFGHAAFFGMGAYGVGLFILHLGFPLGIAIVATLLISVVMGLFVSVIGIRIRGLYFAIFTLAFAEIFYILSQNRIMSDITGAEDGFTFPVPDWINATQHRLTFYYLALGYLVFTFWFIRRLVNSPTGRVMSGLRDNEERAIMLGYNTFWYKTLSIVLAGAMASGAGILRALLNKGASPNVLGVSFTMDPLLMTLIGGSGTFAGPTIGAFLLRLTEQLLRDATLTIGTLEINIGERWALILGGVFILSVMVFPSGIVGTLRDAASKWRARRKGESTRASPSA